jgi:hypothetical protein
MEGVDHDPASELDPKTRAFYLKALEILEKARVPYVVAGAYSLAYHAGITRHTKDLDLFLKRADLDRALRALDQAGYRTERTHPHWLAKAYDNGSDDAWVDLIFRNANGLCEVDDDWFQHAVQGDALGRRAPLIPAEELIWSKSFVQARERFDGADINHVLRARGHQLDWGRLLRRFEGAEQVLLGHVFFFQYVYPAERSRVPDWAVTQLIDRAREQPYTDQRICRGTMFSWDQYAIDVTEWSYIDARLLPPADLTAEQIDRWTNAPK